MWHLQAQREVDGLGDDASSAAFSPARPPARPRPTTNSNREVVPNEPAAGPGARHEDEAEVLIFAPPHPECHLASLAVAYHLRNVAQPGRRASSGRPVVHWN
jgi:hypothetical protein